ncbi:hypothetical protein [Flavobacterium psychrophilum]|uniref:hypothetical protein n=1 Tax=Flavobacterium psychrophilum TaxID=96345 RepID=UPI00061875C4|nr:hypothetical protein [Flavobacterium psychrophilum]MBF2092885.1 hypothetical protein [Flavobacterium psychrophilum]OAE92613.1 hypothetical protein SU65_06895 [Flavobacterium psychrophilum]SNA81992.1 conserved hypothetical protein [Flavobacterium psychrophilum]
MRYFFLLYLLMTILLTGCKDNNDNNTHERQIAKALKEKELVFSSINKTWNFAPINLTPEAQAITNNWSDWRLFTSELYQKPKGTIGAFQRKTKSLVLKVETLNNTIPERISKPQIKSRLMAIITKVKALHTFINLDRIPEKKVVTLITDLNIELNAFQDQIEEIVRRSHIQKEEGEQEMLNLLNGSQPTNTTPITEEKNIED